MLKTIAIAAAAFTAAGCTAYPDASQYRTPLIAVDRADRAGFCQDYAARTASNAYYNYSDEDGGGGFIAYRQAGSIGDRAYQRCLDGRTG